MKLASSPRLPPGDGSLRSKQRITTTGEPSLHFRLAFLVFPLRPIGWEGEGQGEVGQFPASPSRRLSFAPSAGTVPPAPLAGLVSFVPAPFHSVSFSQTSIPLHFIPTVPNCRDRQRQRCFRPRDFVRPGISNTARGFACRRREKEAIARDASHGQDISNRRGDGPAFAALRLRNWPTPLKKLIGLTPCRWASRPAGLGCRKGKHAAGHHSDTLQRQGVRELASRSRDCAGI